jgi:hypothetical protein
MGNLHVVGSQFVNHVLVDDNYTVTQTDYSIFVPNTGKEVTIDLPIIAPNNVGRVLIIKTINSAPITIRGAIAPKDEIDTEGVTFQMSPNGEQYQSVILIGTQLPSSDRWLIVGGYK